MRSKTHRADFCVVGGGLAGLCAAVAAARHGTKTVLMQDRPVLGGNASSEIRMWVSGSYRKWATDVNVENKRETGILEELNLENLYRNPTENYSIWDSVLYESARFQPNLTLLLNCTCQAAEKDGARIHTVTGWQLTTETTHHVEADLFADCSGDGILAPLAGAEFRLGHEAAREFNEEIEPEEADRKTMGVSCLIQARETARPQPFTPPAWAYSYPTCEALPERNHDVRTTNFWWLELGGEDDSIHDTEELRDELLKVAFGVWDHIKNHCTSQDASNWELEWVGFLPGKRESRRLVGDHILTQNDVRSEGRFEDLIAYCGWTMDDHHPGGMRHPGKPTTHHFAPSPFGIPYRCVYSRNIDNLFMAGRNISTTHAALSATRVMATTALLGEAVGVAAAIAIREKTVPRGVYEKHLDELKQTLMDDDCYLPWNRRAVPELSRDAALSAEVGKPEVLRNGLDRPIDDDDNGFTLPLNSWIEYRFDAPRATARARFTFDSELNRPEMHHQKCRYTLSDEPRTVPPSMTRGFRLEAEQPDGSWQTVYTETDNYQRLVRIPLDVKTTAIRFFPEKTWGAEKCHLFAFDVG